MDRIVKIPAAKYEDWRCNIQNGDILACIGKGKIPNGIAWSETKHDKIPLIFSYANKKKNIKGFITHLGVLERRGRHIFITEANGDIVDSTRFSRTYKDYNGHLFIIRPNFLELSRAYYFDGTSTVGCMPMVAREFVDRCLDAEGKKYDWMAIWKQLIHSIWKNTYKENEYNDELFCSELLNIASDYFWMDRDAWCTPHDIAHKERDHFLVMLTDVK